MINMSLFNVFSVFISLEVNINSYHSMNRSFYALFKSVKRPENKKVESHCAKQVFPWVLTPAS